MLSPPRQHQTAYFLSSSSHQSLGSIPLRPGSFVEQNTSPTRLHFPGRFISPQLRSETTCLEAEKGAIPFILTLCTTQALTYQHPWPAVFAPAARCTFQDSRKALGTFHEQFKGNVLCCLQIWTSSLFHRKQKLKQVPIAANAVFCHITNSTEPMQSRSDPFTDASPPWIPMHEQKSLSLLPALNPLVYFKAAFELTWHLQMQNLKLLCWGFKEGK